MKRVFIYTLFSTRNIGPLQTFFRVKVLFLYPLNLPPPSMFWAHSTVGNATRFLRKIFASLYLPFGWVYPNTYSHFTEVCRSPSQRFVCCPISELHNICIASPEFYLQALRYKHIDYRKLTNMEYIRLCENDYIEGRT